MKQLSRQPFYLSLSHFELYVRNAGKMEDFYTHVLGFVVTDRGEGPGALVFLSKNPNEHHQLVLNPQTSTTAFNSPLDHISFRVSSIGDLRNIHSSLIAARTSVVETVSHGTTWSVYFRDPEENRLEIFVDTPWYVCQPCRFAIDLDSDDDEIYRYTEEKIRDLPGFKSVKAWKESHVTSVDDGSRS